MRRNISYYAIGIALWGGGFAQGILAIPSGDYLMGSIAMIGILFFLIGIELAGELEKRILLHWSRTKF